MTTKSEKPEVEKEFEVALILVKVKIERLKKAIKGKALKFERDKKNWGHVGDLNHISRELEDIISSLGGSK